MEIWKDIPGYEGRYQVSNEGAVRSRDRSIQATNRIIPLKGVMLKPIECNGYFIVFTIRKAYIHRLVALTFIANPENKPCVNHINGIRIDNRVENLEWVTYSENNTREGTGRAKLNESQVIEILRKYRSGIIPARLALEYNVSYSAISAIVHRRNWKHLKVA